MTGCHTPARSPIGAYRTKRCVTFLREGVGGRQWPQPCLVNSATPLTTWCSMPSFIHPCISRLTRMCFLAAWLLRLRGIQPKHPTTQPQPSTATPNAEINTASARDDDSDDDSPPWLRRAASQSSHGSHDEPYSANIPSYAAEPPLRLRDRLKPFLPYVDKPNVTSTSSSTAQLAGVQPDDSWIDLGVTQSWLESCSKHHGQPMSPAAEPSGNRSHDVARGRGGCLSCPRRVG